ncbi:HTH_Tnp_Tc3_2 domain-containing protein [Trichonephila clavipes]|nr:HTH_Tnp_Tc3_2 domain-containing protein [Trichonephila clavipes]
MKNRPAFRAGILPGRHINGYKADSFRHIAGNFRPCKRGLKSRIIDFQAMVGCILETDKFLSFVCTSMVKERYTWQNENFQSQRRGKCGAPQAIDDRGERRVQRCVRVNRIVPFNQLTAQMNQGLPTLSFKLLFSECYPVGVVW